MLAIQENDRVLVLRKPQSQGNFEYWIAEPGTQAMEQLQERLSRRNDPLVLEIYPPLGDPMTLNEVMERLQRRNFQVFDLPDRH